MGTRFSDADAVARLEALDPSTAEIRAAVRMREAAQGMVDQAVRDARDTGVTWIEIGLALGVSPQGARQRYT